jgi:hypothetical protein
MGDVPGNNLLQEGRAQSYYLPIGKEVAEKGLHIIQLFRPAQVQQHHSDCLFGSSLFQCDTLLAIFDFSVPFNLLPISADRIRQLRLAFFPYKTEQVSVYYPLE